MTSTGHGKDVAIYHRRGRLERPPRRSSPSRRRAPPVLQRCDRGLRLIRWLGEGPVARVVFEATGAYHRGFGHALGRAGLPLCKVNPRHARRFGEALGQRAKTDRMDAALLARFGVALEPAVRPAPSQSLSDLKELHVARAALVKDRTAAKNREKTLVGALVRRQLRQRLKQIEAQLAEIEAAILAGIEADRDLARRFEIVTSIPGVAARSAFALLIDMPELGTLDGRTAAGLSGTAPIVRQSGKRKGKAFVHGGVPGCVRPSTCPLSSPPGSTRSQSQIRRSHRPRQTAEGCPHRHHAQARYPRQRTHPRQPNVVR